MELQDTLTRSALTGRAVCKVFRGCVLVVIGAGYCAITASALGNSPTTGPSSSITVPSRPVAVAPPPVAVQSRGLLDTKLDYLAAHAPTVDGLYEELMRWTPPCWSASAAASMPGRC